SHSPSGITTVAPPCRFAASIASAIAAEVLSLSPFTAPKSVISSRSRPVKSGMVMAGIPKGVSTVTVSIGRWPRRALHERESETTAIKKSKSYLIRWYLLEKRRYHHGYPDFIYFTYPVRFSIPWILHRLLFVGRERTSVAKHQIKESLRNWTQVMMLLNVNSSCRVVCPHTVYQCLRSC